MQKQSQIVALCALAISGAGIASACPLHHLADASSYRESFLHPIRFIEEVSVSAAIPTDLVTNTRQLTYSGKRSGEGYFSSDGSLMIFQSEREPDNPWYQIYLMDMDLGETELISPGHGKTTCAYINQADTNEVLFASTHEDPLSLQLQQEEIDFRASGQKRRYAWDYDPMFEIYSFDRTTKEYKNLTNAKGYDAEGAYSADGKRIVFSSNRQAYESDLTDQEQRQLEVDAAYFADIYIMNSDGSGLKQVTDAPGYDGGPFFSYDGKYIVWRRFREDGAVADIFLADSDGSNERRVTDFEAMSWAPFLHPTNEYIVFATNKQGFANFELYIVDREGTKEPVRVTNTNGFDGLPVFTPDGNNLVWTSNRRGDSQLFIGNWDHEAALELLEQAPMRNHSKTEASVIKLHHKMNEG